MDDSSVLRKPMNKEQFMKLSSDEKKNYVGYLSQSFNVGSPTIAKMLGISGSYLYHIMTDIGYVWPRIGKKKECDYDVWDKFLNGSCVIAYDYKESEKYINSDGETSMRMFIEECCKINSELNTRVDIFTQIYLAWCRDNEFPPMKKEDIVSFITKEYNAIFPKKSGNIYCNICLNYDKFQKYKNKIKYKDGEDRKTINPYMTFTNDKETTEKKNPVKKPDPHKKVEKEIKSVAQKPDKTFKQTHANGEYEFEGNSRDILNHVASVIDNCNMRVKIVWEVISNG